MTTIVEAMRQIEQRFPKAEQLPKEAVVIEMWSGGQSDGVDAPIPCMCINEDLAIRTWLDAALIYAATLPGSFGLVPNGLPWPAAPKKRGAKKTKVTPADARRLRVFWIEAPEVSLFHITIADELNSHRVVSDRFACHAKIWIGPL